MGPKPCCTADHHLHTLQVQLTRQLTKLWWRFWPTATCSDVRQQQLCTKYSSSINSSRVFSFHGKYSSVRHTSKAKNTFSAQFKPPNVNINWKFMHYLANLFAVMHPTYSLFLIVDFFSLFHSISLCVSTLLDLVLALVLGFS